MREGYYVYHFCIGNELAAAVPSAAPSGLVCLGCGRDKSSSWRGPGQRWCARHKCLNAAKKARTELCQDAKDERIDELEERVHDQAEQIQALCAQMAQLSQLVNARLHPAQSAAQGGVFLISRSVGHTPFSANTCT